MALVRFHNVFAPRAELQARPDPAVLRSVQKAFPGARVQLRDARQDVHGRHLTFRIVGRDFAQPQPRTRHEAHSRRQIAKALRQRPSFTAPP